MNPEPIEPCPATCPRRQQNSRLGAGYVFSAIVSLLLALSCVHISYRLHADRTEELLVATQTPPDHVLIVALTLIGLGLGIEIDKSALTGAIASLLSSKQN